MQERHRDLSRYGHTFNCKLLDTLPKPTLALVNAAVVTDVINPLALAVITGTTVVEPNVPTLEFTVARVNAMEVEPEPVISPVTVILSLPVK